MTMRSVLAAAYADFLKSRLSVAAYATREEMAEPDAVALLNVGRVYRDRESMGLTHAVLPSGFFKNAPAECCMRNKE